MSLASLKRSIAVGTLLKMTRHDWFPNGEMTVHGNLGTSKLKGCLVGTVRPVVLVQSGQIGLTTTKEDGTITTSYLQWPKASCIRETLYGFEIDLNHDGKFDAVMAYEFVVPFSGEEIEAQVVVAAHPTTKEAYEAARQKQAQFVPGSDASLFWDRVAKLI
jgi:hypothetical protein